MKTQRKDVVTTISLALGCLMVLAALAGGAFGASTVDGLPLLFASILWLVMGSALVLVTEHYL